MALSRIHISFTRDEDAIAREAIRTIKTEGKAIKTQERDIRNQGLKWSGKFDLELTNGRIVRIIKAIHQNGEICLVVKFSIKQE